MMQNNVLKRFLRLLFIASSASVVFLVGVISYVQLSYIGHIHLTPSSTEPMPAIILGASLLHDGSPSPALVDRLLTGKELLEQGRASYLLVTGDDGALRTNEVEAMNRWLLDHQVSSSSIMIDGHGYRTIESCRRAKELYGITQAYLITQRFHLGRALYLCESFGVTSYGYPADKQRYEKIWFFAGRDLLASVKAWFEIHL